jgi:hypothetical protein
MLLNIQENISVTLNFGFQDSVEHKKVTPLPETKPSYFCPPPGFYQIFTYLNHSGYFMPYQVQGT